MKKIALSLFPLFISMGLTQVAQAQPEPASSSPFYAGFGISNNVPDNDDEYKSSTGFQLYAGYELPYYVLDMFDVSVEVGYHDTGDYEGKPQISGISIVIPDDFNSAGVWVSAVLGYKINQKVGVNGVLGYDAGDDDGVMFGAGAYYEYSTKITLNIDYIVRDLSDSTQFNVAYSF